MKIHISFNLDVFTKRNTVDLGINKWRAISLFVHPTLCKAMICARFVGSNSFPGIVKNIFSLRQRDIQTEI